MRKVPQKKARLMQQKFSTDTAVITRYLSSNTIHHAMKKRYFSHYVCLSACLVCTVKEAKVYLCFFELVLL